MPQLATGQSPLALDLHVYATDAAGNTATVYLGNKLFRQYSPPVALVDDAAYAGRLDPKSTFAYRLSDHSYDQLFSDTNPALQSNTARLYRVLLYNPWPTPVGVRLVQTNGSYRLDESWGDAVTYVPATGPTFDVDGLSFLHVYDWDTAPGSLVATDCAPLPTEEVGPCPRYSRDTHYGFHEAGSTGQFTCRSLPAPSGSAAAPGNVASALIWRPTPLGTFSAFKNPVSTAKETTAADLTTVGNYVVVPPASGTTPGAVAVYFELPRATTQTPARAARPLTFQSIQGNSAPAYAYRYGEFWTWDGQMGPQCRSYADTSLVEYRVQRWFKVLTSAREQFQGSFDLYTVHAQTDASGAVKPIGASRKVVAAHPITVDFQH